MRKLLMLSCVLILATATSAGPLLYAIYDFNGGTPDELVVEDASGWSNLHVTGLGDRNPGLYKGFYWTPSGGLVQLQSSGSMTQVLSKGISDNGSIITGQVTDGTNTSAAKWDSSGNITLMSTCNNYPKVSGNGIVTYGTSLSTGAGVKVRTSDDAVLMTLTGSKNVTADDGKDGTYWGGAWLATTGDRAGVIARGTTLVRIPGTGTTGTASVTTPRHMTEDGSMIIGTIANDTKNNRIWTWNSGTSAYVLSGYVPDFAGGSNNQWSVTGISGDGKYVVGQIRNTAGDNIYRPFIWDTSTANAVAVSDFLSPAAMAAIPSGFYINWIMGISNDGTTIFGYLNDADVGQTHTDTIGFVAMVPEPATIALLGLGGLFLIRRNR